MGIVSDTEVLASEVKFNCFGQRCRLFFSHLSEEDKYLELAVAGCSAGEEIDFNRAVSLAGDGYKHPFTDRREGT